MVDDVEGGQFSEDEDAPVQRTRELDKFFTSDEYDTAYAIGVMETPIAQVPVADVPANPTVGFAGTTPGWGGSDSKVTRPVGAKYREFSEWPEHDARQEPGYPGSRKLI